MSDIEPELPDPNPTGLWLHRHDHEWSWAGAHRVRTYDRENDRGKSTWEFTGPFSPWHPTFICLRCGDVVEDLSQTVGSAS